MTSVILEARAKINLYLEVLGRLPNGYHAVETLYQSIALADRLTVERTPSGIVVESDSVELPTDERNIVVRAARLFFAFTGREGGLRIFLEKRIPIGGGLGGGSADAAAILIALNELFETHYPKETLLLLGSRLGADVPFCVLGGTAWGEGIGERLTPIRPSRNLFVLLVNSGDHVETRSAFEALGLPTLQLTRPLTRDTISLVRRESIGVPLYNRFESVILPRFPRVAEALRIFRESGIPAALSGSGATVFALFEEEGKCREAARKLEGSFPFVVVTRFADAGVVLFDGR